MRGRILIFSFSPFCGEMWPCCFRHLLGLILSISTFFSIASGLCCGRCVGVVGRIPFTLWTIFFDI